MSLPNPNSEAFLLKLDDVEAYLFLPPPPPAGSAMALLRLAATLPEGLLCWVAFKLRIEYFAQQTVNFEFEIEFCGLNHLPNKILTSVRPGFCGFGVIGGGERKLLPAVMVGGPASSSNLF